MVKKLLQQPDRPGEKPDLPPPSETPGVPEPPPQEMPPDQTPVHVPEIEPLHDQPVPPTVGTAQSLFR
jgi:hypothetical protein